MRIVPIHCVKENTKLAKNIYNAKGSVLLKRGAILTSNLLVKIQASGIYTVYIDDGYSDEIIDDVIKPELKMKAVNVIKDTFKNIENYTSALLNDSDQKDFKKKASLKGMEKYLKVLRDLSDGIVDDLLFSKQLLINMVDIKNINTYTYEHSLNVAMLSLVLGIELKLSRHDLFTLFIGAMLHDVGKAFVPEAIVNKTTPLTDEEHEVVEKHTTLGYDYLRDNYQIDTKARIIALQHHEHYDGNGYPKGMSGDHISKFARIVAIADTYDAMISDSPTSKAVAPHEAIEYLMGNAGTRYDFDLLNVFVRKVIPYPPGTLVRLSTGNIAVVTAVNPNFPLRPRVDILRKNHNIVVRTPLDLLENNTVTIEGVQYQDSVETPED